MNTRRFTIVFTGHVQGVFFRATTHRIALNHDVCGWVRNEPDGTVRCEVEGTPETVQEFLAEVRTAKKDNIVEVNITESAATDEWNSFTVQR